MTIKIRTTAEKIAAATVTQAKKDVRYFLNGVLFEKSKQTDEGGNIFGLTLVSTDGHRLTTIETGDVYNPLIDLADQARDERDRLIIQFDADTIRDLSKKANRDVIVTLEVEQPGEPVVVSYAGTTRTAELIDGAFPDWQRIIPSEIVDEGNDVCEGAFNPAYLADVNKVFSLLTDGKKGGVEISPRGTGAMLVRLLGAEAKRVATMVIMPIRL